MKIHIYNHPDHDFERIVMQGFAALNRQVEKIMNELETLTNEVTENTNVTASAVALLDNIKAMLDAAGTDPVKLKALSDTLDANSKSLADAITRNTPAA